jgi:hypothetical protein
MIYGYARASTGAQYLTNQVAVSGWRRPQQRLTHPPATATVPRHTDGGIIQLDVQLLNRAAVNQTAEPPAGSRSGACASWFNAEDASVGVPSSGTANHQVAVGAGVPMLRVSASSNAP